mgnify:FL=1|jgi:hypothetical protein
MLYIIIALLVLIFVVAAMKQLTAQERAIVIHTASNVVKVTAVYSAKVAKETVLATNDLGAITGMKIAISQQETLSDMNQFNTDMASKGGAPKVAITKVKAHGEALGTTEIVTDLRATRLAMQAELAALRASINPSI